jgi:hypothetical protein
MGDLNYEDAIFYNENSALKLGWEAEWFGCSEFDEDLVDSIAEFQKEFGLTADGMCGAKTYRRIYLDRESEISEHEPQPNSQKEQNFIVYRGVHYPIEWDKVVLWDEEGGLKASKGKYREVIEEKRDIKTFIVHWDVCYTSYSCWKVLEKRGISVHFMINHDGFIYQSCDLNHIAWHAGGRSWNNDSVGVEMNNSYYLKYQGAKGITRPIAKGVKVHGSVLEDHLDFTEIQKEALKALSKAISEACGVPLQTPDCDTVYPPAVNGEYRGIIHHYHLKSSKIDSAGLDLNAIIN